MYIWFASQILDALKETNMLPYENVEGVIREVNLTIALDCIHTDCIVVPDFLQSATPPRPLPYALMLTIAM